MVDYEWCCEQVHRETGDICDCYHADTMDEALSYAGGIDDQYDYQIGLVRSQWDGDCVSHSWAYLYDDGTLPEYFSDSDGNDTTKVPQRFHQEAERVRIAVRREQRRGSDA
jgi:hypothetical protein